MAVSSDFHVVAIWVQIPEGGELESCLVCAADFE